MWTRITESKAEAINDIIFDFNILGEWKLEDKVLRIFKDSKQSIYQLSFPYESEKKYDLNDGPYYFLRSKISEFEVECAGDGWFKSNEKFYIYININFDRSDNEDIARCIDWLAKDVLKLDLNSHLGVLETLSLQTTLHYQNIDQIHQSKISNATKELIQKSPYGVLFTSDSRLPRADDKIDLNNKAESTIPRSKL